MSLTDILLAGVILVGAVYLLYRSICKKRVHCSTCSSCDLDKRIKFR